MQGKSFFSTLREASFRGVPFEVDSADEAGGRRLARHEYPLRDTPYAEDLGRKAGEWSLEAFIVQGRKYDYASARDALRSALNSRGSGTLIHPTLGELTVSVDSFRMKESTREGGYCSFSISFVESGQMENPSASSDTAYGVALSGKAARSAAVQHFSTLYLPLPQELPQCLVALTEGVSQAMDYLTLPLELAAAGLNYVQSCIALPLQLGEALLGFFAGMIGALPYPWEDSNAATNSYIQQSTGLYSPHRGSLPHRNTAALDRLLIGNPVTECAPVAVLRPYIAQALSLEDALATARQDFSTGDDALKTRDTVLAGLDSVAPFVDDVYFAALGDVRLSVARDLTTRGGELPRVTHTVLPATVPSVVAAYCVYGDAKREQELVSRNRIRHPGRVPGGVSLEVLSQ